MSGPNPTFTRRPRDLALLLLARHESLPRARARDQQADLAGESLQREVLRRVAALDPDAADFEGALVRIASELGDPTGPARSVGALILLEWSAAASNSGYWAWLLADAIAAHDPQDNKPSHEGPHRVS